VITAYLALGAAIVAAFAAVALKVAAPAAVHVLAPYAVAATVGGRAVGRPSGSQAPLPPAPVRACVLPRRATRMHRARLALARLRTLRLTFARTS